MNLKEREINEYLSVIASNLDISDSMRKKAEKSYKAVGKWLGDDDSNSQVKIMPQGSFYLGTVIKPVSDSDEYDIDLVCLLKNDRDKSDLYVKNVVGDRLKKHQKYKEMLDEEGKRCWTLNYDEFHMDILPCVPKEMVYKEPILTELRLTHKISEGKYISKYSNPYKYHAWFENCMRKQADEKRKFYAERNKVDIEEIPLYRIKTPLQQAVQLLKRHRDIMYDSLSEERKENAPISIIITTLAALAYNDEDNVFDALKNILSNMGKNIVRVNQKYEILNPVMQEENFADKWNANPKKAIEFFSWLDCAKKELLVKPFTEQGLHNLEKNLERCFGENIVKRSFKQAGDNMKILRENNSLYVDGLKGGLKSQPSSTTKKVGGHTFFGK